jgi:hypothetical protein
MAKGRFVPKHPEKYLGNPNNIIFRSSWELSCCKFFDSSNAVTRWASEEIAIPYVSPLDARIHRYFPDFIAKITDSSGTTDTWLIEVKPLHQTDMKYAKNVQQKMEVAKNEAKWKAATNFAALNNMKFKVLTELDIYALDPDRGKVKRAKPSNAAKIKARKPRAKTIKSTTVRPKESKK